MSNDGGLEFHIQPQIRRPKWIGYSLTLLLEIGLTWGLKSLYPFFPIASFPIPYVLLMMAVAYLFGEGPAILAFFAGLAAYIYFFVYPLHSGWPLAVDANDWARMVAYLLGTAIVGFATVLMRRSGAALRNLAEELAHAKQLAEQGYSELNAILSSMADAVIVIDAGRKVVFANEAALNIVKINRQLGQSVETWIEAANVRNLNSIPVQVDDHPLVKALRGELVSEEILLIAGGYGPDTVVSAAAAPVRSPSGDITGSVIVVRDITLQARLQEEVERQKTLLDTFMQNVSVGLIFQDREMRCALANLALGEINHMSIEDMIGKTPHEYLPPELAKRVEAALQAALSGETIFWRDVVANMDGERSFNIEHIPITASNGDIIGTGTVIVETTEQVRARRELERVYERERRIAETLQASLLGAVPHRIGEFEFETVYRAALEEARVGGDFYDVFRISEDKVGIVIGDVSGKGLTAAVHVATAKYTIRSRAYETNSPASVMLRTNESLLREMEVEGFVTVFLGILDRRTRTVTYANCGHEPVLLWNSSERLATLVAPTGPALGAMNDIVCEEGTLRIHPGDELLLGTDGLFEIPCPQRKGADRGEYMEVGELLGVYHDLKCSGHSSAAMLLQRVLERCGCDLRDDVAILRMTLRDTSFEE
ncbi:MAG: SpoIIE family protein phosphatase [Armatimonadota bacterium]|nr:SpoIIE family protein phosphatase [Armatimonadota bacterium]